MSKNEYILISVSKREGLRIVRDHNSRPYMGDKDYIIVQFQVLKDEMSGLRIAKLSDFVSEIRKEDFITKDEIREMIENV